MSLWFHTFLKVYIENTKNSKYYLLKMKGPHYFAFLFNFFV